MIPSVSSFFSMAELGESSRHQQQPQRESPFQQHFQVHHQPQSLGGSFFHPYPHNHHQQQQQQQQQHQQYTKDWSGASSPSSDSDFQPNPNLNIHWVSPKSQPHVYQQTETSHHTTTTQKTETVTYEKLPDGTVRTTRTRQKNVTSTVTHQRTCTSY